jgi:hypothetical protein
VKLASLRSHRLDSGRGRIHFRYGLHLFELKFRNLMHFLPAVPGGILTLNVHIDFMRNNFGNVNNFLQLRIARLKIWMRIVDRENGGLPVLIIFIIFCIFIVVIPGLDDA